MNKHLESHKLGMWWKQLHLKISGSDKKKNIIVRRDVYQSISFV